AERTVDELSNPVELLVRLEQDAHALADDLAGLVAEHALEARARDDEAALLEDRDAVGGGGEDRVLPVEGLLQGALGLAAGGDVLDDADRGEAVAWRLDGAGDGVAEEGRAVAPSSLPFDVERLSGSEHGSCLGAEAPVFGRVREERLGREPDKVLRRA